MSIKNIIARTFFPYGKIRSVLRGPAKRLKFIVEPGIGVSFALGADSLHYNFLSKKIKVGDIVLDIGANKGQTALVLSTIVGDKGKILAFEPVSQEFKSLEKNIELNRIENITPYQIALSKKEGVATFQYNPSKPTMGKLNGVEPSYIVEDTESIQVKTDTIDNFFRNKKYIPNVIKIDVEGAGAAVLEGASETLEKYNPAIFIELHGTEEENGVQEELLKKGYNIENLSGERIIDLVREAQSPLWCYK